MLWAAVVLVSACYTYLPLSTPQPRSGTRVTVELTDSGAADLAGYLGRNAQAVEGRVLNVTDRQLELSVVSVRARDGQPSYWNGEIVSVPRATIATLKERRLAKGGTLVIGGVVAAGLLLLVNALTGGFGSSSGGGPPPPVQ